MREGPSEPGVQKQAPNYASAAVAQKAMVVSNRRKVGRQGRQVRVEKVNESEPSEDASKVQMLSEPQEFLRCGKSWESALLIDPAAAGVKAARARLIGFSYGTREKLTDDV